MHAYLYIDIHRYIVTGVTAASSGTHTRWCRKQASRRRLHVTGVTAASSGTHTRWCRKQASSLALSSAPVAAGQASRLALWRAQQRDVSIPEGGRGDIGRGLRDVYRYIYEFIYSGRGDTGRGLHDVYRYIYEFIYSRLLHRMRRKRNPLASSVPLHR